MEQFENAAACVTGGHQGCHRPKTATALFVAANPKKDVVEKIEAVGTAFKQAQSLG